MKYNYLFMFVLAIMLVGIVNAGDYPPQKQNTDNNLIISIDNATSCNVVYITYPDGTKNIFDLSMTKTGTRDWNYNIDGSNFTQIGETCVGVSCISDLGLTAGDKFCGEVTVSGGVFSLGSIFIYILFLLICLTLVYFSSKLLMKNPLSKDPVTNSKLYQIKKQNEFLYLLSVLKTKMYIIGLFGIYLSIILFTTFLNNLVYNLNLTELNTILSNVNLVLLWGLVPFILGWLVYLIITFYKTTVEVMKYQFGSIVTPGRGQNG